MTKVAALQGHPLAISSHPAPASTDHSQIISADNSEQLGRARGIRMHRNVVFSTLAGARPGGRDLRLRMDVLVPSTPGPHPLVVYVPGGGFVYAAKAGAGRMRRHVAAAGYVVASVEYRTTRHGATYADGIADVRAAIAYLSEHAERFDVDPARVALWGESAGGYLACMMGVGGEVDAVIDMFGGSALDRLADGFDPAASALISQPGNTLARYVLGPSAHGFEDDPERTRAADATLRVGEDASSFLIFHGDDDRIVSPTQTADLHAALRSAGADSTRYVVAGAGHGEIAVKRGEEKFWTTEPMLRKMIEFLDRTIGPAFRGGT
jgi:acetyl esterase/lipase